MQPLEQDESQVGAESRRNGRLRREGEEGILKLARGRVSHFGNDFYFLKGRLEVEKSKRKVEGDLRVTQETLGELERNKSEVAQVRFFSKKMAIFE